LAHALDAGLVTLTAAVRYLKANHQISTHELLGLCEAGSASCRRYHHPGYPGNDSATSEAPVGRQPPQSKPGMSDTAVALPEDIQAFATLIQACFPDMAPEAAKALIHSPALSDILPIVAAHRKVFVSPHLRSDFVIVILYTLLGQSQNQLQQIIAANPAYQQAIRQSDAIHLVPASIS
jgi:hypothetical protein